MIGLWNSFQPTPNNKLRFANSRVQLPNFADVQQVMANPLAASLSLSHTITNPLFWPAAGFDGNFPIDNSTKIDSSFFTLSGSGGYVASGLFYPSPLFIS